jgi:hypothetical protein
MNEQEHDQLCEMISAIEADPEKLKLVKEMTQAAASALSFARDGAEHTCKIEVATLMMNLASGEERVLMSCPVDPNGMIMALLTMAGTRITEQGLLLEGESVASAKLIVQIDDDQEQAAPALYWCSTEDHTADWFVVAWGSEEAAAMHEDLESFDKGEADAELVCEVPEAAYDLVSEAGRPAAGLIEACGGEFLPNQGDFDCRVVKIAGNVYVEGDALAGVRNDGDRADKPN